MGKRLCKWFLNQDTNEMMAAFLLFILMEIILVLFSFALSYHDERFMFIGTFAALNSLPLLIFLVFRLVFMLADLINWFFKRGAQIINNLKEKCAKKHGFNDWRL